MVSYYNKIEYDLVRAGAQYHTNEWFYRYELANGDTATSSVVGNTVSESKSKDFNNVAGIHISDNTTLYAGFSKGTNLTKKYSNYDRFVGATYNYKDWTFSVEYHNGEANKKSWVKYDSPEVNSTWNMVVIGTTYRF
jgi:hypothetical protein